MSHQRLFTKAQIADAIAHCSLVSPHTVPLLEAAYHGVISLLAVPRGQNAPLSTLNKAGIPAIVVIGDDAADGLNPGPSGWPCTGRLIRWATHGLINATGGRVEDYRSAVALAVHCKRLVLVETGSARAGEWLRLFVAAGKPTINLHPTDGLHPVPTPRDRVH